METMELYLATVKTDGSALKYVPEEFKTPELCLSAIKADGRALKYVPDELKTTEFYLLAARKRNDHGAYPA